jgi:hypothetical protein
MAPGPSELERFFSYAEPVAAAVLIVRLWAEGLLPRYRFFVGYLSCFLVELPLQSIVPMNSIRYLYAYVLVESVLWFFQICMIVELFSMVLKEYPGIARTGRRFIGLSFTAAIVISLSLAMAYSQTGPGRYPTLEQYLLVARVVAFIILAFLLLLLAFLFWFPVQLSRNVVVYAISFSVYFSCRALTRLAANLIGPDVFIWLSAISLSIAVGCLVIWILFLTRRGETVDLTVGHRWQPEDGPALVRRLETINDALLRTARK